MRKKRLLIFSILAGVFVIAPYISAADEWQKLFDGKTLNGWEKKAVHGGNGGEWAVEGGAIVADQEKDHKGGLLGTTKKYSDFEIELEFKVDNPVDTGLFLRTRDDGMGYQITIDYHDKGFIGSLYAPAEGGFIQQNKNWQKWFNKDKWNKLRARVEGQPAHVTAWLNDNLTVNFTDYKPRYPQEGYIGLQVHGGAGAWGETSKARFRNIRVRDLKDIKAETKQ
jgi:3-keto-disaccharide hydrolase